MNVSVVRTVALMTLSYIVDDGQLDLVRLDPAMLQHFLDNVQCALTTEKPFHGRWTTSEILRGFSNLARSDFNRGLMVAQGNWLGGLSLFKDSRLYKVTGWVDCLSLRIHGCTM